MARPKAFDRNVALISATQVFTARGFEGASLEELIKAMGISRQSLYDTFGGKRALYLEALQTYNARNVANLVALARRGHSPLAALREILLAPSQLPKPARDLGCLGVNAVCEFGRSDSEVVSANQPSALVLDAALTELVRSAKLQGEVAQSVDEVAAGRFMQCVLSGLKVAGRAGAPSAVMREMADFAMRSLTGG